MKPPRTLSQHVPETLALVADCQRHKLTEWESRFVASVVRQAKPITDKQRATLRRIAQGKPDFTAIRAAALREIDRILARWLPGGTVTGHEYECRNPLRGDRHPGSFRVNTNNARWSDFATGARGGDLVSLAAYLFNLPQHEAAHRVAGMLGMQAGGARHG